jgi:hypothetical protein
MEKDLRPLTPKDYKNLSGKTSGINRNILSLGIYGFNEDPLFITEFLNLQPNSHGKKGEEYFIGKNKDIKKIVDENYWTYKWEQESNDFIGDFIEKFIDEIILQKFYKFKELSKKCEIQFQIVQYYYTGWNPGVHIDKKKLKVLSEIEASIDIDIYCLSEEE